MSSVRSRSPAPPLSQALSPVSASSRERRFCTSHSPCVQLQDSGAGRRRPSDISPDDPGDVLLLPAHHFRDHPFRELSPVESGRGGASQVMEVQIVVALHPGGDLGGYAVRPRFGVAGVEGGRAVIALEPRAATPGLPVGPALRCDLRDVFKVDLDHGLPRRPGARRHVGWDGWLVGSGKLNVSVTACISLEIRRNRTTFRSPECRAAQA